VDGQAHKGGSAESADERNAIGWEVSVVGLRWRVHLAKMYPMSVR
jgi:hypothetical protein